MALHAKIMNHSSAFPRQGPTPLVKIFANTAANLFDIPLGGISDTPILVNVLHAVAHTAGCLCNECFRKSLAISVELQHIAPLYKAGPLCMMLSAKMCLDMVVK